MSFLSPTPSVPQSEPENGIGSAAKAYAEIARQLSERVAAFDLEPVLSEIARVVAELLRQPAVVTNREALDILHLMTKAEDMARVDALAEALRSCLVRAVSLSEPAAPRSGPNSARVLLRL